MSEKPINIQNPDRRNFLELSGTAALYGIAAAGSVLATSSAALAAASADNLITVGAGGTCRTLYEAADEDGAASANNPYTILLLPGTHSVTNGSLMLPDYVDLVGSSKCACIVNCANSNSIVYNNNNYLSNFTINYTGNGNPGGALIPNDNNESANLQLTEMQINVRNSRECAVRIRKMMQFSAHNVRVVTSGIGYWIEYAAIAEFHSCDTWLAADVTGGAHIGLLKTGYARVYVWGGKWTTGYPPGYTGGEIKKEPDQDVIAFKVGGGTTGGRFELFDVWSIVRNESTPLRAVVSNIFIVDNRQWVRVHGGYFQAEPSLSAPTIVEIDNRPDALCEIYSDTRLRSTRGSTHSTGPTWGVETFTAGIHFPRVNMAGLKRCDASKGAVTVYLPDTKNLGEEWTFVRVGGIAGIEVLTDGCTFSNGAVSYVLGRTIGSQVTVRWGGDQWYITGALS